MSRKLSAILLLAACTVASASAQALKTLQAWTPPWPTFESRVISCPNPVPAQGWKVALDDWICPQSGPIIRVSWCGWLRNPVQATRRYWIAVYAHAAPCQPNFAQRLFGVCVTPDRYKLLGLDCQNRPIYRLSAPLPTPFMQQQGTHYWLQISEADAESITPGAEDFRWASCVPVRNCPAVQDPPFTQPLFPPCPDPNRPVDLCFALYRRILILPPLLPLPPLGLSPPPLTMELRDTSGVLREVVTLEPDADGSTAAAPELPDGTYQVTLRANGVLPGIGTVMLTDGQETRLSLPPLRPGDLNNDGCVGQQDLGSMLANWNQGTCP